MVVDPGIHFKGWTREQAIKYTLEHLPSMTQNDAESYVDRIAIIPGQMTTYGAGELQFKTLRKLAEKSLGPKFDLKEFMTIAWRWAPSRSTCYQIILNNG